MSTYMSLLDVALETEGEAMAVRLLSVVCWPSRTIVFEAEMHKAGELCSEEK